MVKYFILSTGDLDNKVKWEWTCLTFDVDCKTARMGGVITSSNNDFFVGRFAIATVVDNEGSGKD